MSQPASQPEDLEGGNVKTIHDSVHNVKDDVQVLLDLQSTPNQPSQGKSNIGDSSGPLFSIYSTAAEIEDEKKVKSWQKDADGILIFTGLFSAAVAALLTVAVQDLRPNSQDISAFYLGNIYDVLADPNATRSSIPSPVAKPPPFSPPTYAIWVNSLWFLSLVIGLTCALLATSLQQWARRYIKLTQPALSSPEKRARMNAFFAKGADEMHILWVVEQLPTMLHLSLFLFFGGLVIFLFNIDHAVFSSVMWWVGLFSIVYGSITVLPIFRHNSPYYAPLSRSAWFLYGGMNYVLFKALYSVCVWGSIREYQSRILTLIVRYYGWMLGTMEKAAEETVSKRSSEIDIRIFDWTLGVLGEDDGLEKFFEAVPGFFNSKLVKGLESGLPDDVFYRFWAIMNEFLDRTLSSNSVDESVKNRRAIICRDIMSTIPCPFTFSYDTLPEDFFDQAPVSIERLQAMARWCTHKDNYVAGCARARVAKYLASMKDRDGSWIALASDVCGLAAHDLRDNITHAGDNLLLVTLIDLCRRQPIPFLVQGGMDALTQIDIRHTLTGLQHDFCTLWNELVQDARNRWPHSTPAQVLRKIRHLYIALHRGTDAAPTAFSLSTDRLDPILGQPSSYPFCDIANHRPHSAHSPMTESCAVSVSTQFGGSPDASPHPPSHCGSIPQQAEQKNIIVGSTLPSNPATTSKIGGTSHALVAAQLTNPAHSGPAVLQDVTSSAVPKPAVPVSSPLSAPAPAPDSEFHSLLGKTTPSRSTRNATLPHLHARGLVNAVLQLLVHSPPFWNLFGELGDLKGQREAGGLESGGATTPLVDATMRFFEEFSLKEKEPPPTHQTPQHTGGKPMEDKEANKEHNAMDSFEPTYIYHAMKEKRQFKDLLDGNHEDAEKVLGLYLDALDEELVELHTYISAHKPASASSVETTPIDSPISRIFRGRSRLTVRAPSQPDTITVQNWRLLQLNIQPDSIRTVEDALAHVSQPQPVQVGQLSSSEMSQQVQIEALPPVLILRFNRFLYDAAADGTVKISKPVQFAPELEIPPEIMAPVAGESAEPAYYKLYGVLYHHGESAGGGHYTVDVLHPNVDSGSGEAWLRIDDEDASAVQHGEMFGGHDHDRMDDQCAYMLFYCRMAPA